MTFLHVKVCVIGSNKQCFVLAQLMHFAQTLSMQPASFEVLTVRFVHLSIRLKVRSNQDDKKGQNEPILKFYLQMFSNISLLMIM